jgi:hypothetical protein
MPNGYLKTSIFLQFASHRVVYVRHRFFTALQGMRAGDRSLAAFIRLELREGRLLECKVGVQMTYYAESITFQSLWIPGKIGPFGIARRSA